MRGFADAFARERGRELAEEARELLLECVGRDLLLLASELDKLAAAVSERVIGPDDVRRVTAPGREHGNFEFTDALCARDAAAATRLLACALDEGAAPIAIIGALAATLKPLVAGAELVARGRSVDEALRELAVAPYQRVACQRGLRAYRPAELRRALRRARRHRSREQERRRRARTPRALDAQVCVGAPIVGAAAPRRP